MDEPDELELLRRASPVPTSGAAADEQLAALAARIERTVIMDTERNDSKLPARRLVLAAAVVVVVLGIVGAVALAARGSGDDDDNSSTAAPPTSDTSVDDPGPVSPGAPITPGGSAASCVEQYDLTTLRNREMAFDGMVESVDGDSVTFSVTEWFRGGDAETTTLQGASTLGGMTSAGGSVPLEPGSRLLVAGDGGYAWSCGFTQPHDAAIADEWRATVGGQPTSAGG